jgi:hypothetical protein
MSDGGGKSGGAAGHDKGGPGNSENAPGHNKRCPHTKLKTRARSHGTAPVPLPRRVAPWPA